MNKKELELYIHIPFCVRKCSYCDFLSAPATEQTREAYMAALFAEIGGRAKDYSDRTVTSIFIGGGTPSLLSGEQIGQLMDRIREQFAMAQDAEITMEVNPGTASAEKLRNFYTAGINRLSIGMQSAQAEELKNLGRIHDFEGFCQVYREAVEAGFTNINVDIMSGLPGQTLASYRDTLEKVLHLEPMPQHISAYSLIVEEGTPFAAMAERGELPLPEEETERAMYEERCWQSMGSIGMRFPTMPGMVMNADIMWAIGSAGITWDSVSVRHPLSIMCGFRTKRVWELIWHIRWKAGKRSRH